MKTFRNLSLLAACALLAGGCSKHERAAAARPVLPSATVRLAPVTAGSSASATEVPGTIRAVRRAKLAAKLMGVIEEAPVALGQRVKAGDPLVRIAAADISARVAQAKAQLNQVRRDLDRERGLLTQKASTADTVNSLEDRVAMTEAMVREAEVMMGYAVITAPFDGVVTRKLAETGDLAAPGRTLLEIEGTDAFEVAAGIPESLASSLAT